MCSIHAQTPCMPPSIRSALTGHKAVYAVVPTSEQKSACTKHHCYQVLLVTWGTRVWTADSAVCFGSIFTPTRIIGGGIVQSCEHKPA